MYTDSTKLTGKKDVVALTLLTANYKWNREWWNRFLNREGDNWYCYFLVFYSTKQG